MVSRIPIVDFSKFSCSSASRKKVASQLDIAFRSVGFCIAVGHGIPTDASARIRAVALDFFDKSVEEKCMLANGSAQNRGTYGKQTPYTFKAEKGAQLLGDFSAKPPDLVEALSIFDVEQLPAHLPGPLKDEIKAYNSELANFGGILAECAAEAVGCSDKCFFKSNCSSAWGLRMAHYMDQGSVENVPENQLRYGAHVDSYGITLLEPDPIHWRGLQVLLPKEGLETIDRDSLESIVEKEEDGVWVDVPFVKGCLILNVGALLSRWTGNVWKANIHRVIYHPGRRLALVSSALHPHDDVIIEPIPSLVAKSSCGDDAEQTHCSDIQQRGESNAEKRRKLHTPITCKEFIAERMKAHSEDRPTFVVKA